MILIRNKKLSISIQWIIKDVRYFTILAHKFKILNMKNTLIIILAIALFAVIACKREKDIQKEVIISGKIENPGNDSIWVYYSDKFGDNTIHSAALDSNGKFQLSFDLDKPTEATFNDGNENTALFLHPGDSLFMTLNTKEFDESLKYSGKGSCANNYLAQTYLKFKDNEKLNPAGKVQEMNTRESMDFIDSLYQARMEFYKEYIKKHDCSDAFKNWQLNSMLFSKAYLYRVHYYTEMRKHNYEPDSVSFPDEFLQAYEDLINYTDKGAASSEMYDYLQDYFYHLTRKHDERFVEGKSKDSVYVLLIKENFPETYGQLQLAKYLLREMNSFRTEMYENHKDMIFDYITDQELTEKINSKYREINELFQSDIPPNANIIDLNQPEYENVSFREIIDKYKGKVIYLDFWASWCGPCKREMPHSKKLREKLNTDQVVFVYLSTDRDSTSWINMIKKLRMEGDQYRLSGAVRGQSNEIFNVRYIPRYVIYDKDGMVIDSAAPRPGNPESYEVLTGLLD